MACLEPARGQDRLAGDPSESGLDDARVWVHLGEEAADARPLLGGHQVSLVEDDDVGELDLIQTQRYRS